MAIRACAWPWRDFSRARVGAHGCGLPGVWRQGRPALARCECDGDYELIAREFLVE